MLTGAIKWRLCRFLKCSRALTTLSQDPGDPMNPAHIAH
ncbi:hypothetical protein HNR39_000142 [Glaciimonas immobilis]|uniref:Uncharacterized protein n=1 Tax=Glaciimonas immobilis TaxID=728004 RepID=A0A840RML3_9BURK|nr:hypothetical protein [Glaciimonas immobilis]